LPPFQPYTYGLSSNQPVALAEDSLTRAEASTRTYWDAGPQPLSNPLEDQLSGLASFGLGVGALAAAGRMQFGQQRGWDFYARFIRTVEEFSPGRVLRTFQLSHLISPLETASRQQRYISGAVLQDLAQRKGGKDFLRYIARLTGRDPQFLDDILSYGIRFEGGKLFLGKTNKVILKHAAVIRSPAFAAPAFQMGYVRSALGGPAADDIFKSMIKFRGVTGRPEHESFLFIGGKTRAQAWRRYLFGYGTTLVERMNQLARAPFELEPFATIMHKVPILRSLRLGVVPSSGLKTLGKLTGKLGILGFAAMLAYKELDYQARKSEFLDKTLLGEGITAGIGKLVTQSNLAASRIAEYTGLQDYREWQEKIAPGSTSLTKLAAFPIMGALGASWMGYGRRIHEQLKFQRMGLSMNEAAMATAAQSDAFMAAIYGRKKKRPSYLPSQAQQIIHQQTEKRVAGWEGKMAKLVASMQDGRRKGLTGTLARMMGQMTPSKVHAILGIGVGFGLILPFLPGALLPSERPEELEALYAGRKRVPVRKGRWWEFGRSPYEGKRVQYYRQHWYPRMLTRAREKAIYGEDMSPFERFFHENFTYELEKKHYYERPYPVTGTAFEDIPFIGPVLAATIGRFFKPPKLMHTEDWMRVGAEGEELTVRMPEKYGYEPVAEEVGGELPQGSPISPYGAKGVVGEQIYRMTEMIGLPGFTMTAIKEAITGESDTFAQEMQLESARRLYGAERAYWDLELGGGIGTTELVRRLYPHRRRQIPMYNPIRNRMPEWLPGAGERAPDFLKGDPYAKVQEGELRLPGPGYAALYPELEGVAYEDYPLIHRFAILADVAPYTERFKQIERQVRASIKRNELSEQEIAIYRERMEEVKARKVRKQFSPYKYRERKLSVPEMILAEANELEKEKAEEVSLMEEVFGSYWETLAHESETPLEYLTPISPGAKLIHMRTAVEDYERTVAYGTENAFWGHPIRDFFKPFADTMKHALGWEGEPSQVSQMRELEEYFDILEYVKYTALKRQAARQQDEETVADMEQKRRETLFGINPYTYKFSQIFRALPRRERDYFNAFVEADMEERAQIIGMVPENEQALYIARWQLRDADNLRKAIKKGLLTEDQVEQARQTLNELYRSRDVEGMPTSKELWVEYLATRLDGESYADWYRRRYLLAEKLDGRMLPGPDWKGWHPSVDLEDIKLKIVQDEGRNMFEYDLWPDRARMVARRPAVEEAAEELRGTLSESDVRSRMQNILEAHGLGTSHVSVLPTLGESVVDLDITENRDAELISIARKQLLN